MAAKTAWILTLGVCVGFIGQAVSATWWSQSQAPDVLTAAPKEYQLEFENEYVRVSRVKFPAHGWVSMHAHPTPGGVIVALTDQDARLTAPDGSVRDVHYKAGQVRWAVSTPAVGASTQTAHSEENLSDKPFELIRVDPKVEIVPQRSMPTISLALDQVKWTKMADGSGRETADLFGDRSKRELFGYLVKWPKNAIAKAHSHPDDRHGMVLSGTFYHGHGTQFDFRTLERRSRGTYFTEPARDPHFGATKDEETVLYFVGIGPDRIDQIEK